MVFPGADGVPRHPSQLYEAALEGLAIFVVLWFAARSGALRRPGLFAGAFGVVLRPRAHLRANSFAIPIRELERLGGGLTMGMLLSRADDRHRRRPSSSGACGGERASA